MRGRRALAARMRVARGRGVTRLGGILPRGVTITGDRTVRICNYIAISQVLHFNPQSRGYPDTFSSGLEHAYDVQTIVITTAQANRKSHVRTKKATAPSS